MGKEKKEEKKKNLLVERKTESVHLVTKTMMMMDENGGERRVDSPSRSDFTHQDILKPTQPCAALPSMSWRDAAYRREGRDSGPFVDKGTSGGEGGGFVEGVCVGPMR